MQCESLCVCVCCLFLCVKNLLSFALCALSTTVRLNDTHTHSASVLKFGSNSLLYLKLMFVPPSSKSSVITLVHCECNCTHIHMVGERARRWAKQSTHTHTFSSHRLLPSLSFTAVVFCSIRSQFELYNCEYKNEYIQIHCQDEQNLASTARGESFSLSLSPNAILQ